MRSANPPSMNIYAAKYVPLWLRAVNESFATFSVTSTFPTIDYQRYISDYAGTRFAAPVDEYATPALTRGSTSGKDVTRDHYGAVLHERLQYEYAEQSAKLELAALYNVRLLPTYQGRYVFALNVPGLRENAPRLDLGDFIHLRPLNPVTERIGSETEAWYAHGRLKGHYAPGFSGTAFIATVWGIDRAKESVLLHVDGFDASRPCNITFALQNSKIEPSFRAVNATAKSLAQNHWIRCMLFPRPSDGCMQTDLSPADFDLQWHDALNWEQKKAVDTVLKAQYGTMPYLISGPPGTGKTKTLVELALQLLARQPVIHILICTPSDAAADTIAIRLAKHLSPDCLFRLCSMTRTFAEVPSQLLPYTFTEDNSFALPVFERVMRYRIVVTTCRDSDILVKARLTNSVLWHMLSSITGALLSSAATDLPLHWSALLLDEAGQATEPETLTPLQVVLPPDDFVGGTIPRFVLAGDEHQLGPSLASIAKTGLEISLFQRLGERDPYRKHELSRANGRQRLTKAMLPLLRPAFTNLIRNYRSHPSILAVPSMLYYYDTLIPEKGTSDVVSRWSGWQGPYNWPILFINNTTPDDIESVLNGTGAGSGALFNDGEAQKACSRVASLLQSGMTGSATASPLQQHEITVMSPFRAQVTHLRKVFRGKGLYDVNIGPLEAFQGLEARIVIICTTRTRLGQDRTDKFVRADHEIGLGVIDEPRRLNVAITRAREGLIVIGNAECLTCTKDHSWIEFLRFCERNGCVEDKLNATMLADCANSPETGLEKALKYDSHVKSHDSVHRNVMGRSHALVLRGLQRDFGDLSHLQDLTSIHPHEVEGDEAVDSIEDSNERIEEQGECDG